VKPFRYAAWLSLSYLIAAGVYIRESSHLAARFAKDIGELEHIERVKGLAFVAITGIFLWALSWLFFSRLQRSNEERAKGQQALMLVQSKIYAGELAATVAHDFNNLLMVLRSGVDEAAEHGKVIDAETIDEMRTALDGARNLAERLARAARGERATRREAHSLAQLVADTVRLLRRLPRVTHRVVDVVVQSPAQALLDPVIVEQIVVNLLLNAADACGENGTIRIEIGENERDVWLSVHDNGPGLSDSENMAVFEPFKSTKGGMGLGLLSVRACAEAGNGKLIVGKSPLGGAMFEVRWPRAEPQGQSNGTASCDGTAA
jgi:signal transduction histidine kinase